LVTRAPGWEYKGEVTSSPPEARQVAEVEQDLARAFPQVPVDKIKNLVGREWVRFVDAPVREYVPLLVRRLARDQLRGLV
jgi:hypothetical protein